MLFFGYMAKKIYMYMYMHMYMYMYMHMYVTTNTIVHSRTSKTSVVLFPLVNCGVFQQQTTQEENGDDGAAKEETAKGWQCQDSIPLFAVCVLLFGGVDHLRRVEEPTCKS